MEGCKCPHCGSKDFYVHEFEYWEASVDEDEPNTREQKRTPKIDLRNCDCMELMAQFKKDVRKIKKSNPIYKGIT